MERERAPIPKISRISRLRSRILDCFAIGTDLLTPAKAREQIGADPLFDLYFWKRIIKVLLINAFTVPMVVALLFLSGLVDEPFSKAMDTFQKSYPAFFWPLDQFFKFTESYVIKTVVIEELFTRSPVRILIALLILFKKELNWWLVLLVLSVGLFLNYQWAGNHTVHELVWLPVFVAGLPWLWLVIRTNRLWPSVFCHVAANLSIYFLIKIYQLLL
ncbi:MAG: CPBP family intramembrane metalloprotease [Candidatus Yanofskybacteria bacterium]|nr:CPBP family intramembrane metalloprotease [Candidatus Yanofskybacteria bacterium]